MDETPLRPFPRGQATDAEFRSESALICWCRVFLPNVNDNGSGDILC